jgi:hypothetical protein
LRENASEGKIFGMSASPDNRPQPRLVVDNDAPMRRRRQVALPQAAIARFGRVAASLGPNWHVEADLETNIIRLFQGAPPVAAVTPDDPFARGLGIVP